jgi:hypothetical protein
MLSNNLLAKSTFVLPVILFILGASGICEYCYSQSTDLLLLGIMFIILAIISYVALQIGYCVVFRKDKRP